jgi:hypothetical protein
MAIAHFHPRSTAHRPETLVKLQHNDRHLFALFRVRDRYVRCVHTAYESDTHQDSCVELFLRPSGRLGYFALEINCGGACSFRHIEDWTRTANRFARWSPVAGDLAATMRIAHSMPSTVDPEIAEPVEWWIELALPMSVLEASCGPVGPLSGQRWEANAYKCGDGTSHPHWASWAPVGESLNFHNPDRFGLLEFLGEHA